MEFFGMGSLEILLILLVGLIAFGPGRIPELARNLAKFIRTFRRMTTELTAEVSKEFKDLETEEQAEEQANKQQKQEGQANTLPRKAAQHETSDAET